MKDLEDEDIAELRAMIENHLEYTSSSVAERILADWDNEVAKFVKVIPNDYKKVLLAVKEAKNNGLDDDMADLKAFESVTGKKVSGLE